MATNILLPLFAIFASIYLPIAESTIADRINISISAVFNFGGSSSDTGSLISSAVYQTLNPPYGQNYFNSSTGRYSDGRIVLDFLMEAIGLPFLNPYLDSVGAPSFQKGCNFAAGGSTIIPPTLPIASPFPFRVQVSQFLRFKSRVIELLSKDKNLAYLPKENDFTNGLYMVDIGHNDLIGAFHSKTFDQIIEYIPAILAEFEAGINRLYDNGARNFWIHNTDPIGCLAMTFHRFGNDPSKLDEMGCVSLHNQAARLFNDELYSLVRNLQAQHPNAYFSYVDMYAVKANLIANYSRYGFKQAIMACCGFGGPPLNHDPRISCGQTKILNGTSVTAEGCTQSSEYINWDGAHYTEAASQIIASQILTGKFSDPPFHLKLIES